MLDQVDQYIQVRRKLVLNPLKIYPGAKIAFIIFMTIDDLLTLLGGIEIKSALYKINDILVK